MWRDVGDGRDGTVPMTAKGSRRKRWRGEELALVSWCVTRSGNGRLDSVYKRPSTPLGSSRFSPQPGVSEDLNDSSHNQTKPTTSSHLDH